MKITYIIVLAFIAGTLCFSCKKNEVIKDKDIYIDAQNESALRFYIKNGDYMPYQNIIKGDITGPLFVNGNDLYYPAVNGYLKNGTMVHLPDANRITSVFVKDNDVYAAGTRLPYGASYWKNGNLVKLQPDSSDYDMTPWQIIVEKSIFGIDVFVGGSYVNYPNIKDGIAYWKNNELHILDGEGRFAKMAISGPDLYIVGGISPMAGPEGVYWKNGVKNYLYNKNNYKTGPITSVTTDGSDVYMTALYGEALYWKNGERIGEANLSDQIMDIKIDHGHIYVVGMEVAAPASGFTYKMLFWDNGVAQNMGPNIAIGLALGN